LKQQKKDRAVWEERFFVGRILVPTPKRWGWPPQNDNQMICHSEGATRSKSKPKKIKFKGDVPKATATEESLVQTGTKISFRPGATKKQTLFSE
jgi:hypothetical protein